LPDRLRFSDASFVDAADRAALEEHAIARDRSRRARMADRARSSWANGFAI
jgi:hypothetical protein